MSTVVYTATRRKKTKGMGRVSWPGPGGRVWAFWREVQQRWSFIVDHRRRLLLNCSPPAHAGPLDVDPAVLVCGKCGKAYSALVYRRSPHWCDECRTEEMMHVAEALQAQGVELGVHATQQSETAYIARQSGVRINQRSHL